MDQTEALIIETIDRHREEILEFARDIYSHAELGYKEFQTSGKFVKKMEQLGLRTEKGFAITGVKAYLNEDKKENASLALLGELDHSVSRSMPLQILRPMRHIAVDIMHRWQACSGLHLH